MPAEQRRILLLTGTAPRPDGVGGIILHDLAAFLPPGTLSVAYVLDAAGTSCDETTPNGDPMRIVPVPFQRRPESRWGRPGRALDWVSMRKANQRHVSAGVRACVEYARAQCVDEVWAVLDTPAATAMAVPVAEALGVPLRTTVWDDVEHNVRHFGLDRFTAARFRKNFGDAIRRSERVAVIGETMQAEYERLHGKRGVILRHGAEQPSTPDVQLQRNGELRVGFAGSVSARSAFDCLLKALDRLAWSINGREVTLVLMGQRFDLWSNVPRRIECLGYRSVDETIRILSGCRVNFLPQPFEADWRAFAELSFPSKLTTYLAARVPILLHAPPNASLPAFFARYPFGAYCDALDVDQLAVLLVNLCSDQGLQASACDAARRALDDEFSVARFRSSFADFIDMNLASAT